jgi:superoxide dismutase, Cu-Zn family
MMRTAFSFTFIGTFIAVLLAVGACERDRDRMPVTTGDTEIDPGGAAPGTTGEEKPDEGTTQRAENLEDVMTALGQAADARALMESPDQENRGSLYLLDEGNDVVIIGFIKDLEPGVHGIHIHEKGDCSARDFTSAGGHYNPTSAPHAAPFHEEKHVGDLGNLITNEKGTAVFGIRMTGVPLDQSPTSIVGKALVIHEKADDFTTQPDGAAGARVACGVIRVAAEGEGQDEGQGGRQGQRTQQQMQEMPQQPKVP